MAIINMEFKIRFQYCLGSTSIHGIQLKFKRIKLFLGINKDDKYINMVNTMKISLIEAIIYQYKIDLEIHLQKFIHIKLCLR